MGKVRHNGGLSIGASLGALALKECRLLLQALTTRKERHGGIHHARRACRKLRSLLDFLETSSDQPHVEALHKSLRRLVHSFSDLRDAHVATRTARLLASSHTATVTPALIDQLKRRSAALLDAALDKDPDWRRRSGKSVRITTAIEALGWSTLTPTTTKKALKHSIKRMKKARRAALEKRTNKAFHRWRRRARQVRYQLEFLRKARQMAGMRKSHGQEYGARAKQLGLLTDRLGWRQDFRVFLMTLDRLSASDDVLALREALARKSAPLSKTAPTKVKHAPADTPAPPHTAH
ncbi:CHAD domain-containing protein [Dyella flava]|uniref:CHAD domain-containing protein n=1 Tax=Dyella flava TaxID=1920170 RepID=A0ABS2K9N9_9GAMM|nr:CHAD domain-containing protein [Dyella flava]MBM7127869.1 CHAD domain-containing protein [Dyella flava]GLQ51473.1 hypothetical protein GCM10010872_29220 [Dyella flava]